MGYTRTNRGRLLAATDLQLVILPVIVFDEQGYRVGDGQGYYDRLLAQCKPDVTQIGLCFEDPVQAIADLHAHDVPMDYCVTPSHVFRWARKA